MKRKNLFLAASIAWLLLTIFLLILPGREIPDSGFDIPWMDKWAHIFLFGVLTLLWGRVFRENSGSVFLLIAVLAVLLGTGLEFVQKYWVTNRSFEGGDIVADSIGAFAGAIYGRMKYIKK